MQLPSALLSTAYFAPVPWYVQFFRFENIFIERHEHYRRQTWRNRCRIIGPNGIEYLVVPVHARNHTPVCEVKIDYSENWQKQHWGALVSAYGKSPYFEHYRERIEPFFTSEKPVLLFDLNTEILQTIFSLLRVEHSFAFTAEYESHHAGITDFREVVSPKNKVADHFFAPKRYTQVFEERHGFIPGLSILDLLFCCGPGAKEMLEKSLPGEKEQVNFGN